MTKAAEFPAAIQATVRLLESSLSNEPVIWVGAGTSIAAGYSSTNALIEAMRRSVDAPMADGLDFTQVADEYVSQMGQQRLSTLLQRELGTPGQPTSVHRAIAHLAKAGFIRTLITTNYDDLLERALGDAGVPVVMQILDQQQSFHIPTGHVHLVKLHGSREDWSKVILSGHSYQTFESLYRQLKGQLESVYRTNEILFVGCSMRDPRVLEWLLPLPPEEKARMPQWRVLITKDGLQELRDFRWDGAKAAEAALAGAQVRFLLMDKHSELNELWGGASRMAARKLARKPPRSYCSGRDSLVQDIVELTLSGSDPIAIVGAPGVGKSTALLKALHHPRLQRRFGARCFYVQCQHKPREARFAQYQEDALYLALAEAMGLSFHSNVSGHVLRELGRAPSLVVFDNFDEAWDAEREGALRVAEAIHQVGDTALLVSLRGRKAPGPHWRCIPVARLSEAEARELFIHLGGARLAADPHIARIDTMSSGLPLIISLLARLADAEGERSLASLWSRWEHERKELLQGRSAGETDTAAGATFRLALDSWRIPDEARRLLRMLSLLPDGMSMEDVQALLGEAAEKAAAALRDIDFTLETVGRIRLLNPIQEYVSDFHPPGEEEVRRVWNHYLELAGSMRREGGPEPSLGADRLVSELRNIEWSIRRGLRDEPSVKGINTAVALTNFMAVSGRGSPELLIEAAGTAEALKLVEAQARALHAAAHVQESRGNYVEAERLLRKVIELPETPEDRRAQCHVLLAGIELTRDAFDEAERLLRKGLALALQAGSAFIQAEALRAMGHLACTTSDLEAAERFLAQAGATYARLEEAEGGFGLALTAMQRGLVAYSRGDFPRAIELLTDAVERNARMRNDRGHGECLHILGSVYMELRDLELAGATFGEAWAVLERSRPREELAMLMCDRASLALLRGDGRAEAQRLLEMAGPLVEKTRQQSELGAYKLALAEFLAAEDPARARLLSAEAVSHYMKARDFLGAGLAHLMLSSLAMQDTSPDAWERADLEAQHALSYFMRLPHPYYIALASSLLALRPGGTVDRSSVEAVAEVLSPQLQKRLAEEVPRLGPREPAP